MRMRVAQARSVREAGTPAEPLTPAVMGSTLPIDVTSDISSDPSREATRTASTESDVVIRPQDGVPLPPLGMVHKVGGELLAGRLLVMEGVIPPGTLIHPHTHTREDECSFILDGELQYLVGDAVYTAGRGSYVPKPRGVRHAFWNWTEQPARVMEMHTPATFDTYYDE